MENETVESSILIVDDEPKNIQVLGTMLQAEDYDIEFATNGEEAIEWSLSENFDLILLDVMMPGMDGFEVCARLKENEISHEIPVIFLTAKTETESIVRGFEIGAVDYITKPFNKNELLLRVKTHLDLKHAKQSLRESYGQLEQHFTELQASHRKLEDLDKTKMQILEKMSSLNDIHFSGLKEKLQTLNQWTTPDSQEVFDGVQRDMHAIEDTLHTFKTFYQSEKAIQSKRVLLAETSKKQQIIAKMALGGTGVELDVVSSIEEGRKCLETHKYDILCANTDTIELTEIAQSISPEIQPVFMTSEMASDYLAMLRKYPHLYNIVSRSEEEPTFTLKNISTTIKKLVTNDYFGMDKYLNWGIEVNQRTITRSDDRADLIQGMEDDLVNWGIRRGVIKKCALVTEELLMNAIYDAPVDSRGSMIYNHLPRTEVVELKPEEHGIFRYGSDGLSVAISVEDPFGAFGRDTILDYLESCYQGRAGTLQQSKGGAGQGLYFIMETSDLVVFNVNPRIRTEVIAIFNIAPDKLKKIKTRSFHYFLQNS